MNTPGLLSHLPNLPHLLALLLHILGLPPHNHEPLQLKHCSHLLHSQPERPLIAHVSENHIEVDRVHHWSVAGISHDPALTQPTGGQSEAERIIEIPAIRQIPRVLEGIHGIEETTGIPGIEETPGIPGIGETRGIPEALGIPETQGIPETLGIPETQGVPEKLRIPENPGIPDPGTPEILEIPGSTGETGGSHETSPGIGLRTEILADGGNHALLSLIG